MRPVISFFLLLSVLGWMLCFLGHIRSFTNLPVSNHDTLNGLFGGLFLIFLVATIASNVVSKGVDRDHRWRAVLRGCPTWMRGLPYLLFGYAVIIFLFTPQQMPHEGEGVIRVFSAAGMAFYGLAFVLLYSARRVWNEKVPGYRCRHGHEAQTFNAKCPRCGTWCTVWEGDR